jgi:outer membrane murein-binding lipoprotein Lpp
MSTKTTTLRITALLLAVLGIAGCSKQSSDSASDSAEIEAPEFASKKMVLDTDKMAEDVLQSANKMEAADWLKRYPKSQIGDDEEGRPILLSAIVARLNQAGAQRVVVEYVKLGQGELLAAMVVVLPTEPASRQKLFAMEPELSQLCDQTPVTDRGQKYLHYSFD